MSLADDAVALLRSKGYPKLEEGAERGLEKAIERAKDYLRSDEGLGWGGAPVRAAALDGLDRLSVMVPHTAHLAADEVRGLLDAAFAGLGLDVTTQHDYFGLTFEERRGIMHGLTDELAAEVEKRNKAWEAWKDTLRDLGTLALRTLVPLVLAAL